MFVTSLPGELALGTPFPNMMSTPKQNSFETRLVSGTQAFICEPSKNLKRSALYVQREPKPTGSKMSVPAQCLIERRFCKYTHKPLYHTQSEIMAQTMHFDPQAGVEDGIGWWNALSSTVKIPSYLYQQAKNAIGIVNTITSMKGLYTQCAAFLGAKTEQSVGELIISELIHFCMHSSIKARVFSLCNMLYHICSPVLGLSPALFFSQHIWPFLQEAFNYVAAPRRKFVIGETVQYSKDSPFNGFVENEDEVDLNAQSGVEDPDWINILPLGAGIASIVAAVAVGSTMDSKSTGMSTFKKWADYGSNLSKIKAGITTVSELATWIVSQLKKQIMSHFPELGVSTSFIEDCKAWDIDLPKYLRDTSNLLDSMRQSQILADAGTPELLKNCLQISCDLLSLITTGALKPSPPVANSLTSIRVAVKKFADHYNNMNTRTQKKRSPFHISFFGDSGVGKSEMVMALANDLVSVENGCTVTGLHLDNGVVYARSSPDKFWSRYNQQPVLVLDDLFQTKGAAPETSEFMELILMTNEVPFMPNMAEVEKKGILFDASLILSTTNTPYPHDAAVRHTPALWRRRQMLVKVEKVNNQKLFTCYEPCPSTEMDAHPLTSFKLANGVTIPLRERMTYRDLFPVMMHGFNEWCAAGDIRIARDTLLEDGFRLKTINELNYGTNPFELEPQSDTTRRDAPSVTPNLFTNEDVVDPLLDGRVYMPLIDTTIPAFSSLHAAYNYILRTNSRAISSFLAIEGQDGDTLTLCLFENYITSVTESWHDGGRTQYFIIYTPVTYRRSELWSILQVIEDTQYQFTRDWRLEGDQLICGSGVNVQRYCDRCMYVTPHGPRQCHYDRLGVNPTDFDCGVPFPDGFWFCPYDSQQRYHHGIPHEPWSKLTLEQQATVFHLFRCGVLRAWASASKDYNDYDSENPYDLRFEECHHAWTEHMQNAVLFNQPCVTGPEQSNPEPTVETVTSEMETTTLLGDWLNLEPQSLMTRVLDGFVAREEWHAHTPGSARCPLGCPDFDTCLLRMCEARQRQLDEVLQAQGEVPISVEREVEILLNEEETRWELFKQWCSNNKKTFNFIFTSVAAAGIAVGAYKLYQWTNKKAGPLGVEIETSENEKIEVLVRRTLPQHLWAHASSYLALLCASSSITAASSAVGAVSNALSPEMVSGDSRTVKPRMQRVVRLSPQSSQEIALVAESAIDIAIAAGIPTERVYNAEMKIRRRWQEHPETDPIPAFKKKLIKRGLDPKLIERLCRMVQKSCQKNHALIELDGESHTDERPLKLAEGAIKRNAFTIRVPQKNGINMERMHGLGIVGNIALCPFHIFRTYASGDEVEVTVSGGNLLPKMHMLRMGKEIVRCQANDVCTSNDLVMLNLGSNNQFTDIRKHLMREEDLAKVYATDALLLTAEEDGTARMIPTVANMSYTRGIYFKDTEEPITLPTSFKYAGFTKNGDCGSPLLAANTHLRGVIMGFHIASTPNRPIGHSCVVTYEWLLPQLEQFAPEDTLIGNCAYDGEYHNKQKLSELYKVTPDSTYNSVVPSGVMAYVGTVDKRYAERVTNKSEVVPSPLYGKVDEPVSGPSVLSRKDPRLDPKLLEDPEWSPLNAGSQKYAEPTKPFSPTIMGRAINTIIAILSCVRPRGFAAPRLLTDEEAINGVPEAGYNRINPLTSPGIPYKYYRPAGSKGKRYLLQQRKAPPGKAQEEMPWRMQDENLIKNYYDYEEKAKRGERTLILGYTNCKDERRPLAKVRAGLTRTFECLPLHFTLLVRKYYGCFIAMMNQNCINLPSSVGIDPTGPAWTALCERLNKHGGKVIAGDFKAWDGRLDSEVMYRAVDILNAWYNDGPVNARVRKVLMLDIIQSMSLCGNTLVMRNQGIPSGVPITADWNSLCNWIYMIMAFITLAERAGYKFTDAEIKDIVEMAFYGDDHILAPCKEVQHFFHFNSVQQFFKDHDILYTDALKKGTAQPDFIELVGEATYLKRKFASHHSSKHLMLAPIDTDTIQEEINWLRTDQQHLVMDAMYENIETALRESYHHGQTYFNNKLAKINQAIATMRDNDLALCLSSKWEPVTESFENLDRKWLEQHL